MTLQRLASLNLKKKNYTATNVLLCNGLLLFCVYMFQFQQIPQGMGLASISFLFFEARKATLVGKQQTKKMAD